jgi:hypothetical protein
LRRTSTNNPADDSKIKWRIAAVRCGFSFSTVVVGRNDSTSE